MVTWMIYLKLGKLIRAVYKRYSYWKTCYEMHDAMGTNWISSGKGKKRVPRTGFQGRGWKEQ